MKCPECKHDRLIKFGKKWVKVDGIRTEVPQYQCKDCGRITIKPEDTINI